MKGKYNIVIKKSAAKEIKKLPQQSLKKILSKISSLSEIPRPPGCKKLSGENKYGVRVGDYRIVYLIEDKNLIVVVVKVSHRKNVYK